MCLHVMTLWHLQVVQGVLPIQSLPSDLVYPGRRQGIIEKTAFSSTMRRKKQQLLSDRLKKMKI